MNDDMKTLLLLIKHVDVDALIQQFEREADPQLRWLWDLLIAQKLLHAGA